MIKNKGFTVLEILIVLLIVALLSMVVIAAVSKSQDKSNAIKVEKDLLDIKKALYLYATNNSGKFPCHDHNWADATEVAWSAQYIDWPRHPFATSTNEYHLEHGQYGFMYSISIRDVRTSANALLIDQQIDDGSLSTGMLRGSSSRLEYLDLDQPDYITCH